MLSTYNPLGAVYQSQQQSTGATVSEYDLVGSVSASSVSAVDLTWGTAYDTVLVTLADVRCSDGNTLGVRMFVNSVIVTDSTYANSTLLMPANGSYTSLQTIANTSSSSIQLANSSYGMTGNTARMNGQLLMRGCTNQSSNKVVQIEVASGPPTTLYDIRGSGSLGNSTAGRLTGIRIYPSTGTISGEFRVYGVNRG